VARILSRYCDSVIDLHTHVLPGVDDGPGTTDGSLLMARAARADATRTMVATPHVSAGFPTEAATIAGGVERLNEALSEQQIDVKVVAGAEVDLSHMLDLDDDTLRALCLGDGPYILVETPYTYAPDSFLDQALYGLQLRGFLPILAHPERSASFLGKTERLAGLVERGILCSITAGSMAGSFGRPVQEATVEMFTAGLVHDVASDAHDDVRRPPGLRSAFDRLDPELPGLAANAEWYVFDAPAAILAGDPLPEAPPCPKRRSGPLRRRLRRRVAGAGRT